MDGARARALGFKLCVGKFNAQPGLLARGRACLRWLSLLFGQSATPTERFPRERSRESCRTSYSGDPAERPDAVGIRLLKCYRNCLLIAVVGRCQCNFRVRCACRRRMVGVSFFVRITNICGAAPIRSEPECEFNRHALEWFFERIWHLLVGPRVRHCVGFSSREAAPRTSASFVVRDFSVWMFLSGNIIRWRGCQFAGTCVRVSCISA